MSGLKDVMKGGWHPQKGKVGGIRSNVAGLVGKGKDTEVTKASTHQSAPLSALKDPATFAPPPKHRDYYGDAVASRSVAAGVVESDAVTSLDHSAAQRNPSLGTNTSRTGLPSLPQRTSSTDPVSPQTNKPSLPPRLPPRQDSRPVPVPAPQAATVQASSTTSGLLNQGATKRLGQAGISVSGLSIGGKPSSSSAQSPGLSSLRQSTASPTGSLGGKAVQKGFSRFASSPTSSDAPAQGTSFEQKQSALRTANSLRNDPSSVSLADAKNAASTANNFKGRHGDQVAQGWTSANRLNNKYGIAEKIGQISPSVQRTPGVDASVTSPAATPAKRPPPPPPKRKDLLSTSREGSAPPLIPIKSKPT
ncbi:MAG: hypothetical protein M1825_004646 [Sarcosagium campestre]|nr:MAG: hypothetical protein M1825_004646 [Sarcosagium campestre]